MKRNLGFKCDCGHIVFASTDYFGEHVICDYCGKLLPIPLGFYNKIPAVLYPLFFWGFAAFLSILYLKYGDFIGRSPGWTAWLLPLWLFLIMYLFSYHIPKGIMFSVYSIVLKKDPFVHRGLVSALGGDDIAFYVPLGTYSALTILYFITYRATELDILSFIRNPWFFMLIGGGVAAVLTAVLELLSFEFAPRRLKKFWDQ